MYLRHHFRIFSTSYISQRDACNTLWCGYKSVLQIYQNWSTRFLWFIIDWNNRTKFAISFNVLILLKIMFAIYFKVCWWIVILFNSWQKIPSEIEKPVVHSQRRNYWNDSSVKDIKFHWKIAVLIPGIRSHRQHCLSKVYFRKHDEVQAFPAWHFSQKAQNQLYGPSYISECLTQW